MNQTYTVRCSDCGSLALRTHLTSKIKLANSCPENQIIKTECPSCDYLLITCSVNGKVIDAHSSTTSVIARKQNTNNYLPTVSTPIRPKHYWSSTQQSA
ncbi:MAG: hypothetical protein ACFCAD_09085 [Pleurocapsa sp.]